MGLLFFFRQSVCMSCLWDILLFIFISSPLSCYTRICSNGLVFLLKNYVTSIKAQRNTHPTSNWVEKHEFSYWFCVLGIAPEPFWSSSAYIRWFLLNLHEVIQECCMFNWLLCVRGKISIANCHRSGEWKIFYSITDLCISYNVKATVLKIKCSDRHYESVSWTHTWRVILKRESIASIWSPTNDIW